MDVILGNPANFVFTRQTLRDIVDSLVAVAPVAPAAGPLNGAKVHWFSNDFHPTLDMAVGDIVAPTFAGYAASAGLVFGASFDGENGSAVTVAATVQTVASADPVAPESIYGYALTNAAGTVLYGAERFAAPVTIARNGDGTALVPQLAFPR